jgi:hypothetical protein
MHGTPQRSRTIIVSGVGFPLELAERIFDPFFTTKPGGTGMGLRISRSIIESHGGRLWGVGTPGHGATFHLSLPITRNVSQSLTTSQSSDAVAKPIGGATHQGHRELGWARHSRTTQIDYFVAGYAAGVRQIGSGELTYAKQ